MNVITTIPYSKTSRSKGCKQIHHNFIHFQSMQYKKRRFSTYFSLSLGIFLVVSGCSFSSTQDLTTKTKRGTRVACNGDESCCLPSYPAIIDEIDKLALRKDSVFIEKNTKESRKIWREIHRNLHMQGDTIPIVAYGSLMSPRSASSTLTHFKATPVWLCGYTRSFNLDAKFWKKEFHPINGENNRGLLSLRQNPTQRCNAIVLEMNEEDFIAARRRESAYKLIPAKVCSYPSEKSCNFAYVFVAEDIFCSKDILPLKEYYYLVWSAVSSDEAKNLYGENFAEDFLNTSFLANGNSVLQVHSEYQKDPQIEYVTPSQNKN